MLTNLYFKATSFLYSCKKKMEELLEDERGEVNIIAIIIILAIALLLAELFKHKIAELCNDIWDSIGSDSEELLKDIE